MIPTEGMTPTGRKKLTELIADLDRELQIAGSLVSAYGKRAQAERVDTALREVAALQKKGRTDIFTISCAMVDEDIASGRTPSRSIAEIVEAAELQVTGSAVGAEPAPAG
jgi:hypothetical protein